MQNGLAIFITQFGTTDAAYGQNDNILYLDETKEWLDWADLKGISWANWSLSNIDEPCSQLKPTAKNDGNWSEEDLSISVVCGYAKDCFKDLQFTTLTQKV